MSLIAPLATASAASPTINLFTHGHKKGGHAGSTNAAASSTAQGPATTQSLLSSVLDSIEQVIGISVTAPPHAAPGPAATPANLSQSAQSAQSGGNQTAGGIGANVNLRV